MKDSTLVVIGVIMVGLCLYIFASTMVSIGYGATLTKQEAGNFQQRLECQGFSVTTNTGVSVDPKVTYSCYYDQNNFIEYCHQYNITTVYRSSSDTCFYGYTSDWNTEVYVWLHLSPAWKWWLT